MPSTDKQTQAETLFRTIPYFKALDQIAITQVVKHAALRTYEPGQIVIMEGEQSQSLYIMGEGWLKAVKLSPDGREQVLEVIGQGEVLNAIGIFAGAPYPGSVIALERSELWVIAQDVILDLIEEHPAMARSIIIDLAKRVQHLIALIEDLSLRPVDSRLARMLLDNATNGLVERRRWATQAEIAARLGTVTDVINRALRSFAADQLIEVTRSSIRILDEARLAEIAGHPSPPERPHPDPPGQAE